MLQHLTKQKINRVVALNDAIEHVEGMISIPSAKGVALAKKVLNGPSEEKLAMRNALKALSRLEINELFALALIGRDFDGSFAQAVEHVQALSDDEIVGMVDGKSLRLSTYLRTGLERISN